MRHGGPENRLREEDQVYGTFDDGPGGEPDEGAIFQESRVQRGEGVPVPRDPAEIGRGPLRPFRQDLLEALDLETVGPGCGRRERARMAPVDEDELDLVLSAKIVGNARRCGRARLGRRLERHLPDRRDVRIFPGLVADRRKAFVVKTRHAGAPDLRHPLGVARRASFPVSVRERPLEPGGANFLGDRFHQDTGAGCAGTGGSFSSQE